MLSFCYCYGGGGVLFSTEEPSNNNRLRMKRRLTRESEQNRYKQKRTSAFLFPILETDLVPIRYTSMCSTLFLRKRNNKVNFRSTFFILCCSITLKTARNEMCSAFVPSLVMLLLFLMLHLMLLNKPDFE